MLISVSSVKRWLVENDDESSTYEMLIVFILKWGKCDDNLFEWHAYAFNMTAV